MKTRWSIGRLLPLILGGLILAAVLPVILVGSWGTRDVSSRLLRDRGDLLIEAVVSPIEGMLRPVARQMDAVSALISEGKVDPLNDGQFQSFSQGLLASLPQVSGIALISSDGTLHQWARDTHGTLSNERWLTFGRQYLDEARKGGSERWSTPFFSNVLKEIVITYRTPLRRDGEVQGVLMAAVSVSSLSAKLDVIGREFDLVPFILAGKTEIVAHPALAGSSLSALATNSALPAIDTIGDPVLARIWTDPRPMTSAKPLRQGTTHWTMVDGQGQNYVYRELPFAGDGALIAGFHFPSALTWRDRWMSTVVAGFGSFLLLLAILASARLARSLARPMVAFGKASKAIGEFDFRPRDLQRWEASRVNEVASTASAMQRTAQALSFFERYVPKTLVRQLLSLGADSARPVRRDMTVLFLDLEGYARFAESHGASEVAEYLNRMFGRIGPIIEASGGTIDKYTGDGLMAFWGAPTPDAQHASHAMDAALQIAREIGPAVLEESSCRIRIGLHSGEAVVGDLGYAGRMNYTVVGETVNIAKRVESAMRGKAPHMPVVIGITTAVLSRAGLDGAEYDITPLSADRFQLIGRKSRKAAE